MLAPDDGGAGGPVDGLTLKAPGLQELLAELNDTQKQLFKEVKSFIEIEPIRSDDRFEGLKEVLQDFKNVSGLVGGGSAVATEDESPAEFIMQKEQQIAAVGKKLKPKAQDLFKLPVEFSMGYLYLGDKFDQMIELLGGEAAEKKEDSGGPGGKVLGMFKGLLAGAGGIALLAGSMLMFAGAAALFTTIDWPKALIGLAAFSLFVLGSVVIANTVQANMEAFKEFAMGVILLAAGLAAFSVAVIVAGLASPFLGDALGVLFAYVVFLSISITIAQAVAANMGNFIQFGLGMLALTASLLLFAGTIYVMALVAPMVDEALPVLLLAVSFIAGAILLSVIASAALPYFITFGLGMMALMGALGLFAGIIYLFALVQPFVEQAVTTMEMSLGFLLPMLGFITAVGLMLPVAALFTASMLLLGPSLLLWTGIIALMGLITEEHMSKAEHVMDRSGIIIENLATLATTIGWNIVPLTAMGASMVIVAAGIGAFAVAMMAMSDVAAVEQDAIKGLNAMGRFMFGGDLIGGNSQEVLQKAKENGGFQNGFLAFLDVFEGGGLFGALMGEVSVYDKMGKFGQGLKPFSEGIMMFADALKKVAELGDQAGPAADGLGAIMDVIIGKEKGDPESVLGMLDSFDTPWFGGTTIFEKLNAFSEGLNKFAMAMNELTGVMFQIIDMGESRDEALDGLRAIMDVLIGQDLSDAALRNPNSQKSLLNMLSTFESGGLLDFASDDVFEKLEMFSGSLAPFFSSLGEMLTVLSSTGGTAGGVGTAISSLGTVMDRLLSEGGILTKITGFYEGEWTLRGGRKMRGWDIMNKVREFGDKVGPVSEALTDIVNSMNTLSGLNINTGDDNLITKFDEALNLFTGIATNVPGRDFNTMKDRLWSIKDPLMQIGEAFKLINDNVNPEKLEDFFNQLDRASGGTAASVDTSDSDDPARDAVIEMRDMMRFMLENGLYTYGDSEAVVVEGAGAPNPAGTSGPRNRFEGSGRQAGSLGG